MLEYIEAMPALSPVCCYSMLPTMMQSLLLFCTAFCKLLHNFSVAGGGRLSDSVPYIACCRSSCLPAKLRSINVVGKLLYLLCDDCCLPAFSQSSPLLANFRSSDLLGKLFRHAFTSAGTVSSQALDVCIALLEPKMPVPNSYQSPAHGASQGDMQVDPAVEEADQQLKALSVEVGKQAANEGL